MIPVKNDRNRLTALLQSIRRAESAGGVRAEVIVVDNGSSDGSGDAARDLGAQVKMIPSGTLGFLRNRGVSNASGDIVAFVDADHTIDDGWLSVATESFEQPGIAAVGSLCLAPPNGTWVQRTYDKLRRRAAGLKQVQWLGSGNLLVRRSVFEAVGGFDPSLETCEDVDLCRRIRALDYAIVSDDRLRNVHWGDPATLKALFFGELWRGRGNLIVSIRIGLTELFAPSVAMPLMNLVGLSAMLLSPLAGGYALIAFSSGLGLVLSTVAARSLLMLRTSPPHSLPELGQTVVVAGVYELARTLSLLGLAGHGLRRRHRDVTR